MVAEATAREVGQLDLSEALEPTALIALHDRERGRRYAVRWLQRRLGETETPTIDHAMFVTGCLAALGGSAHVDALEASRGIVGRGSAR